MSLHAVERVFWEFGTDPQRIAAFRADLDGYLKDYRLEPDEREMIKQVKPTKRLFSKLCAKKEGQTIMFDLTLELARNDEAVMGKLGHYFKALYDEDLVEEEVIVECHGKLDQESAEAKASKSFVEWCVHEPPAILTPCPCRARA